MTEDIKFIVSSDLKNGLYLTQDDQLVHIENGEIIHVGPNPFINKKLPFVFLKSQIEKK